MLKPVERHFKALILVVCDKCGKEMEPQKKVTELSIPNDDSEKTLVLCEECASNTNELNEYSSYSITKDNSLNKPIIFGILAGLASALVWYAVCYYSNLRIGYLAIALGWLVSKAVIRGVDDEKRNEIIWISVVATFISMIFSEYLLTRQIIIDYLIERGATDIPLILPFDLSFQVMFESLSYDPSTLFFWAIALYEAYIIPKKWIQE